jgi:hypothetical protein
LGIIYQLNRYRGFAHAPGPAPTPDLHGGRRHRQQPPRRGCASRCYQSATSSALNELESLLDAQLFDRIGKRLQLNDNGRALMPQARAAREGA